VHIRRGDYLIHGFKTMTISEYSSLLSSVNKLVPEIIFITSDSGITTEERAVISSRSNSSAQIIYLDSEIVDSFKVHCLMRLSNMLITSNSTFSFTAALLGKESQTIFSPSDFYNSSMPARYNDSYRSAGKFLIWDRDNYGELSD
jgi:hypothetical protein